MAIAEKWLKACKEVAKVIAEKTSVQTNNAYAPQ
jgi:hypothetical protein